MSFAHFASQVFSGEWWRQRQPELGPQQLHQALEQLLVQYLMANPSKVPSSTSVHELIKWSRGRIQ